MNIPANADPNYFDLGACGPLRTDLAGHAEYCGLFRTPSLRNVALRKTFYHNGAEHDLRKAVAFYVERDTEPEKWYPRGADGTRRQIRRPAGALPRQHQHRAALRRQARRYAGADGAEIDDIVAFLNTLTDGYKPPPLSAKISFHCGGDMQRRFVLRRRGATVT